jgi:hypothetical protein
MENLNDQTAPIPNGIQSADISILIDRNIAELHYTLDRARELSSEMGLEMMIYLLSMAQCELSDVKYSRVAKSPNCEA